MDRLRIFDPTTEARKLDIEFVPRPKSIQNLRIGLIENRKFNSDKLLLKIASILEQKHGAKSHIIRSKRNPSVPAHNEIIDELVARCDVVITGIGD